MTEQELLRALENDIEFSQQFKWEWKVESVAKEFPSHAEAIRSKYIALALSSDSEFIRLIQDMGDLIALAKNSPRHSNVLVQELLDSDVKFLSLFKYPHQIIAALQSFPDYVDALIQKVLKDPSFFDRLIRDDNGLHAIKPFCQNIPTIQRANSFQELRAAIKAEMLEKNKEAASAKISALNRGGFFQGSEPVNTGSTPDARRTSHLPPELRKQIADEHFGPKKK